MPVNGAVGGSDRYGRLIQVLQLRHAVRNAKARQGDVLAAIRQRIGQRITQLPIAARIGTLSGGNGLGLHGRLGEGHFAFRFAGNVFRARLVVYALRAVNLIGDRFLFIDDIRLIVHGHRAVARVVLQLILKQLHIAGAVIGIRRLAVGRDRGGGTVAVSKRNIPADLLVVGHVIPDGNAAHGLIRRAIGDRIVQFRPARLVPSGLVVDLLFHRHGRTVLIRRDFDGIGGNVLFAVYPPIGAVAFLGARAASDGNQIFFIDDRGIGHEVFALGKRCLLQDVRNIDIDALTAARHGARAFVGAGHRDIPFQGLMAGHGIGES